MFESSIEELSLARVADYERLVHRLLLEREALAAAAANRPASTVASGRRFLHPSAWRRPTAVH